MKIPGTYFQIMSNQCTNFQKNSCTQNMRKQNHVHKSGTDRQTFKQTKGQTDRVKPVYPTNFVCGGYHQSTMEAKNMKLVFGR